MKIKKIFAMVAMVVLCMMCLTSINVVAADTGTHYYDFEDYDLSAGQAVEVDKIAEGLRVYINDITAENRGCKVTFYVKYKTWDTYNPLMKLSVNPSAMSTLQQTVSMDSNSITFDWDTVLSKANWSQRQGIIREIYIGTNEDIAITGVEVYVPQKQFASLSAGAGCEDLAVPVVR